MMKLLNGLCQGVHLPEPPSSAFCFPTLWSHKHEQTIVTLWKAPECTEVTPRCRDEIVTCAQTSAAQEDRPAGEEVRAFEYGDVGREPHCDRRK